MNLKVTIDVVAFLALIILAVLAVFGVQNVTLAIALSGLFIGCNIWINGEKIASK